MVWPAIIAAGASLLGGAIASSSASKDRSAAQQMSADDQALTVEQNALDRQQQLDFAQQGIRWRVEDAQAAGIHPLYSMGANIPTYSPTSSNFMRPTPPPSGNMGGALARAGQSAGRALAATRSSEERQLSLTNMQLQNDLLVSRIALNSSQVGAPFPVTAPNLGGLPGQASDRIIDKPMERIVGSQQVPSAMPGAVSDRAYIRVAPGEFQPVMSRDAKELSEDQIIPEAMFAGRNYIQPRMEPPRNLLEHPDSSWMWIQHRFVWKEVRAKDRSKYQFGPQNYRGPRWTRGAIKSRAPKRTRRPR